MSTFFKTTFSSSNNSTSSLTTNTSKTSKTSTIKNVTPQNTKKSLTYILNTSRESELSGHHSIGVNSLLYNKTDSCLISGGRDGQISIWHFRKEESGPEPFQDEYETFGSNAEMRQYIQNNINNEEEFQNLQYSTMNNFSSSPIHKPTSTPQFHANSYLHHFGWINDLQLLNDQKTVASCSNDLSIKLWNYNTNTKTTLGYHDDYVKKIRFSSKYSNQLVSAGLDKVIKIWDIEKKASINKFKFTDPNSSIYSLDVNSNFIICSGPSNTVYLFDRRDMKAPVKTFSGHTDNVKSLILKDISFLSASSDTTVKLWDLRTTRVLRNFDMHSAPVWSLYSDRKTYDFSEFYSGDKSGILLKTDLRTAKLDPTSDSTGYLNYKINESLGLSTVIADVNCVNDIDETENLLRGEAHLSGVHDIVEIPELNTLWTAISSNVYSSNTNFISSWAIPKTGKLVLQQGVALNRKMANIMEPSFSNVVPMNRAKSYESVINDADDLVSQLSSEDLDQIDHAILSNSNGLDNLLHPPVNSMAIMSDPVLASGIAASNCDNAAENPETALQYGTFFINFNGDLNTHFLFTDDYYETEELDDSKEELMDPFNKDNKEDNDVLTIYRRLTINSGYIDEQDALLLPFNIKPVSNIAGTSGLVRCRILNNRRHVATMDQGGCIYIYDILIGKLIKRVEFTAGVKTANDGSQTLSENFTQPESNINLIERFGSICDGLQSSEALPTWCSAQVKSGQLFITIQENTFTSCEMDAQDFFQEYKEVKGDCSDTRVNLGKCVVKSFFGDLAEQVMAPRKSTMEIQQPKPVYSSTPLLVSNSINIVPSSHQGVKIPQPTPQNRVYSSTPTGSLTPVKNGKRGLFGRLKSGKKEVTPEPSGPLRVNSGDKLDSYLDTLNQTHNTKELINFVESHSDIYDVLRHKPNYEDQFAESEETPQLKFSKCSTSILIVVNEETSHETRPAFTVRLEEITDGDKIEKYEVLLHLPVWLTKGLILHLYPIPSHLLSTVGFILLPAEGSTLSAVEENGSPLRLNSTGTLRVKRMIAFTRGKLPEKENDYDIELVCKGVVLGEKETLGNIKIRIWKQGGDVEIKYRVKQ